MIRISCPNEKEVRELIARGQWPAACPEELRAHVATCRSCSDLVLVSESFKRARAVSLAAVQPVPPAILMWRAQLRRRNAAVERISRPLLGAQIFAFLIALLAGIGFVGLDVHDGGTWLSWSFWQDKLTQLPQSTASQWASSGLAGNSGWNWMLLVPALATLLLLGGLAVYLATDKQ
jgi:hypothetical protein